MNTLSKNFSYLLMIAILGLSACSSGGSSSDPDAGDGGDPIGGDDPKDNTAYSTPSSTVSGVVVDGYIRKAQVCVDLDRDNECDVGAPYVMADGEGAYSIDISELSASQIASAQIIAQGGTDNDTGQRYIGLLKAPLFTDSEGTINLSPLNTLLATQLAIAKESLSESVVNSYKDDLQEQLGLADGSDVQSDPKKNSNIYDASIQVQEGIEMYAEALRVEIDSLGEAAAFDSAMEALAAELLDNGSNGSSVSSLLSTTRIKANSDTAASDDVIANIFAGIESVTVDGETVNIPEQLRGDLVSAVAEIGTELANAETASDASLALSLLVAMVDAIKETIARSNSLSTIAEDALDTNVDIPPDGEELDKAEIERLFDLIGANSDELDDDYSKYIDEVFDLDDGNEIAGDTSVDSFADLINGWIASLLGGTEDTAEQEEQLEILDTLQAYINGTLIETSSEYLTISDVVASSVYLLDSEDDDGISFTSYNQLGYLSIALGGVRFEEDATNAGSGRVINAENVFNPKDSGSFVIKDKHTDLSETDDTSSYLLSAEKGWLALVMQEYPSYGYYGRDIYYSTSDDGEAMILSYKDTEGNFYPFGEIVFQALEVSGKTRLFDVANEAGLGVLDENDLETISHKFSSGHELIIDGVYDTSMILNDYENAAPLNSNKDETDTSADLESYLDNCNGTLATLQALEQEGNELTSEDFDSLLTGCAPFETNYWTSTDGDNVTEIDYIVFFDNFNSQSGVGKIYSFSMSNDDDDGRVISSAQVGTYAVETLSSDGVVQFTDIDWWQTLGADEWVQRSFVASDGESTRLAYSFNERYGSEENNEIYYDKAAVDELLDANVAAFDGLFENFSTSIQLNIVNTKVVLDDECQQVPSKLYLRIDGRTESKNIYEGYFSYVFSTLGEKIIAIDHDTSTGNISLSDTMRNQYDFYFVESISPPVTYYAYLYGYDDDGADVGTNYVELTQSGSDNDIQLQLADAEFEFWCY